MATVTRRVLACMAAGGRTRETLSLLWGLRWAICSANVPKSAYDRWIFRYSVALNEGRFVYQREADGKLSGIAELARHPTHAQVESDQEVLFVPVHRAQPDPDEGSGRLISFGTSSVR
jgi:hypothetical protein